MHIYFGINIAMHIYCYEQSELVNKYILFRYAFRQFVIQKLRMSSLQVNLQDERTSFNETAHNQRITNIRLQKQLQFLRESKLQYRVDKIEARSISANGSLQVGEQKGWELPVIGSINLDRNEEGGAEISYRILIEKGQLPIDNQLVLLIPKSYPFHEPLYYYEQQSQAKVQKQAHHESQEQQTLIKEQQQTKHQKSTTTQFNLAKQLASAQRISELLFWMPKYKILELVELIAIKINQKHAQQHILGQYFIANIIAKFNSPLIVFALAILLRVLVGLGSYSGKGDWPNLGDFEAHRNWMSITVSKPIADWYFQPSPREDIWWRIDYPPVAAYLSYVFGSIYKYVEPQAMMLQQGYQSQLLFTFMRLTVLITEVVIVFPALYLLSTHQITSQYSITKKYTLMLLASLLLKPDLISIDHGHFQYNSLIIGLILGAFYCLLNRNHYTCCLLFTIAIHSKQMAVYYALAFFAGLIGNVMRDYRGNRAKIVGEIIKFGFIVLIVSLIIWLPFILTGSAHLVLEAIFPVHRGLYQLKVQNFWCISDVFMKWQTKFTNQHLMFLCFTISTLFSLPSMLTMILCASKKTLTLGFYTIAMTFFMFSYHVHQKSILLPLAMAPLLVQYLGPWFVSNLVVSGMVGMYHLLKEDGQWMQYFVLVGLYVVFMESYNCVTCELGQFVLESGKNKTLAERMHEKIFPVDRSKVLFSVMRLGFYMIPLGLHLAQILIPAPQRLEYLHHLLFAFYSFCFNSYSLVMCNGILVEYLGGKISGKKNEGKQN